MDEIYSVNGQKQSGISLIVQNERETKNVICVCTADILPEGGQQ